MRIGDEAALAYNLSLQLDDIPFIGIDNRSALIDILPFDAASVRQMHMAVNEITGGIFFHQIPESFKAGMREILPVINMIGGRVGQQDIKSFFTPDTEEELSYPPVHFPLGVLVKPLLITHGAAQPQNAHSFIFVQPSVNADASFRRRLFITVIMVSMYIQHRSLEKVARKDR